MAMGSRYLFCSGYRRQNSVWQMSLISGLLLTNSSLVQATAYTPEMLRQAYIDASEALSAHDPAAFERLGLYYTPGRDLVAERFSQGANYFNSASSQLYELNPQNMAIRALPGDLSQRTLNYNFQWYQFDDYLSYYLYTLTDTDPESIRSAQALAREIAARLPPASVTQYQEPGRAINLNAALKVSRDWSTITRHWDSNAASWNTAEAQTNWGLDVTKAGYAYALGITGKGVNIGVLDSGIMTEHSEFAGSNGQGAPRVQTVTASGVYYANHPSYSATETDEYGIPVMTGELRQGEPFTLSGAYSPAINDEHGTEISALLAASRDGSGVQGVAFNANLFVANTGGTDSNRFQGSRDLDYNVFAASYAALAAHNVILVNQSWGQDSRDAIENDVGDISSSPTDNLAAMKAAFRPFWNAAQAGHKTWLDAMAEAGRQYNFVQVVSSANNSLGANPATNANLPWFYPELETKWLSVSGLNQIHAQVYNQCGSAKWWCVLGPSGMPSATPDGGYSPSVSGTSAAAPNISGAMALIAERFPYLAPAEIRNILLTTSTLQLADNPGQIPTETGLRTLDYLQPLHDAPAGTAQVPNEFGWGIPNLQKAMQGPGQLLGSTVANLPAGVRDIWANDISDEAIRARSQENDVEQAAWQQTMRQKGWLNGLPDNASADDKFEYAIGTARAQAASALATDSLTGATGVGSLVKLGDGELTLSGNNSYRGSTWIRQGTLSVDGTLVSPITVDGSGTTATHGGTLAGTGQVQQVTINQGGAIAPGHSVGTLRTGDITFNSGSLYLAEVNASGSSDSIHSAGRAQINGGTVAVALENRPGLLSQRQVRTLLGQRYTLLTAAQGIDGQFSSVQPNYLFLGTSLSYAPDSVTLNVGRNAQAFSAMATTRNTRELARAADTLAPGNPVLESIFQLTTPDQARLAFNQLSGQIHADMAATLINDSRYIRDTLYDRLRQADGQTAIGNIQAAEDNGSWAKILGAWGHASSDGNASAWHSSTWGALFGFDAPAGDTTRIGVASGYTRTQLNGSGRSSANSDNFPLALYAGQHFGNSQLRAGAAYTWHHIDTSRSVFYGSESGRQDATYNAQTAQLFTDASYHWRTPWLTLEPFVNLSYINYHNQSFHEHGDAAALGAQSQNNDATASTLGMRADKLWYVTKTAALKVGGELGWLHQYGSTNRNIRQHFTGGGQSFDSYSVPASRDGMVIRTSALLDIGTNTSISLGYSGLLSDNNQDNSVEANLSWRF
ncbi:serine protease [Salmonella enterica subsp. enterica serovar Choleraesuis]|nr:serine protease [Salmonella enterica subsp. enterica serovar Choleraesuis]